MLKIRLFSIVIWIIIVFCAVINSQDVRQKEDVTCKQAYELIEKHKSDSNFVIIDFRPQEKYNAAHIKNALYLDVFSEYADKWLSILDKDKTYLIYCTIGHRSKIALKKMKDLDFKNLYHLFEGLTIWEKEGYEIISK